MTFSNRGGFGGGRSQSFSRGSFGGDRGSDRPAMFDAVCAKCGQNCQVPFKPNGRKEIFCSKCFETNGGENRNSGGFRDERAPRRFERRDSVDTYFAEKQMFSAICDECGDNCQVPFRPRGDKPVLCSNCFAAKRGDERPSGGFSKQSNTQNIDLDGINAKLDKIIKLLSNNSSPATKEILEPKEITEKILEEVKLGADKKIASGKAKKKVSSKKKA